MNFKYVILPVGDTGVISAILVPKNSVISHAELAMKMGTYGGDLVEAAKEYLGAGFCHIDSIAPYKERFVVWGESVSLHVKAQEQDAVILNRQFKLID